MQVGRTVIFLQRTETKLLAAATAIYCCINNQDWCTHTHTHTHLKCAGKYQWKVQTSSFLPLRRSERQSEPTDQVLTNQAGLV